MIRLVVFAGQGEERAHMKIGLHLREAPDNNKRLFALRRSRNGMQVNV